MMHSTVHHLSPPPINSALIMRDGQTNRIRRQFVTKANLNLMRSS